MGDTDIARRVRERLEKTAVVGGLLSVVGTGVMRAATNAPINVAGTVALGTALGPGALLGHTDPQTKALQRRKKIQSRYLAARAGGTMKTGSVNFDEAEVRQALAIRRSLEKTAGLKFPVSDPGKMLLGGLLLGPAAMLGGLGMAAAGAMTMGAAYGVGKGTELARGVLQGRRYDKMVKADPSLKTKKARIYFNVLDKASPYIAGEPHVAAATVRSMLEAPEGYALHPKYMKDILGVEEARQKTRFPMLRAPTFKGELPDMSGGGG